jgi:hypothetical protein
MNSEIDTPEEVGKKPKERSAAYPKETIQQSLAFVANVYKNFRLSPAKRNDIISVIENVTDRDLACGCYYSFLTREKDNYQVTDLYRNYSNYVNPHCS